MSIVTSFGREPGFPKYKAGFSNGKITHVYNDRRKIIVTDETALGEQIMAALPTELAYVGQPLNYGSNTSAYSFLKEINLDRDKENRLLYYLDMTYSSDVDEEQAASQSQPPDQRKASWAWDFETVGYVMRKDVDDSSIAVANSAQEPYELETEIAIPILTVERWESFFDPSVIINYVNHRNVGVFWTAPANAAVCTGIRDREDSSTIHNGFTFRKVTYNFKFMVPFIADVMEGAKEIVADIGTRYKLTAGATSFTEYRSTGGMPTKCALNTDGTLRNAASTLLFKKFNKFPQANFNDLYINNTQI